MTNALSSFSPPARGLLVAGAFALVIGLMKIAAPILVPLLLAVAEQHEGVIAQDRDAR